MDQRKIDEAVQATRAYCATEEGKRAWTQRRRHGLNDSQLWGLSVIEAADRIYTGEEVAAIVAALQGRGIS